MAYETIVDWASYLDAEQHRFIAELIDFVRIPSVSAKPENASDIHRAADWVAARLRAAGVEIAQVMPTKGHPVVYGEWLSAGADKPTILIYGHFDVQPAEPFELWDNPPFEPELRDGKLWGRGASDDKGGMLASIIAVEALLKTRGSLPVNVKFLYEGEEEVGSASFRDFVEVNAKRLKADMAFSADGLQWSPDQPQILQAMKATVSCEIRVTGPRSDQHSGLHGGGIANPAVALAHILASLKSADGLVTIDGFYDDVVPLSQTTRDQIALLPFDEAEYLSKTGAPATHGEPGYTVMERIAGRPMLDVNGLASGWQGDGSKTIIPSSAIAKITCRLVHAQSADKVLQAIQVHVEANSPTGVTVEFFAADRDSQPFSIPHDHRASALASEVLEEVYGKAPYGIWAGGSIPAFSPFLDFLGMHAVMLGFSHGDENLHAPNEFFRLDAFRRGQEVYARLLEKAAG